jgi:LacI family transcriptional regulator
MGVNIRFLAERCGVSTATISRALAGHPSVLPATRKKVEEMARKHGYTSNRLVGSVMAHLRQSRRGVFVGNLALVHVPSAGQTEPGEQQRRIIQGAQNRARELGFQLYQFSLGEAGMRVEAVQRMLRARGVLGLIFLYSEPLAKPLDFRWDEFVVVELDYGLAAPTMHTICHDHYRSMTTALTGLRGGGYRRAGLFLERYKDQRTSFHWSAAFRSFQEQQGGIGQLPILMVEKIDERAFAAWYRQHRPDLVLGHFDACVEWLGRLGRQVPGDVGFFTLNWEGRSRPSAGIDPRLEMQGVVATETLVAQVQRGERGVPSVPRSVLVPGRIVEGPTARMQF